MVIIKILIKIEVSGYELPNEPSSNFQLIDAAKALGIKMFRGVFMRDSLPFKTKLKECGIISLDDSSGTGTHDCARYKNKNKKNYS